MTLHEMQRRLDKFEILQEVRLTIEETAETIADFNRKQLFAGKRSTGTDIKPEYAAFTILIKDQKGQPTDRVTLKDTGEFYEDIEVDVNSETFELISTNEKTEDLKAKYGQRILGLSDNNKSEYVEFTFFPALRARVTKKLGFKFS